MSPEIRKEQLKTTSRLQTMRKLEAAGLVFATDMGNVDNFYTPQGDPVLVVPQEGNINRVERIFYLEASEQHVRQLIKESKTPTRIFPANPQLKMRGKIRSLSIGTALKL